MLDISFGQFWGLRNKWTEGIVISSMSVISLTLQLSQLPSNELAYYFQVWIQYANVHITSRISVGWTVTEPGFFVQQLPPATRTMIRLRCRPSMIVASGRKMVRAAGCLGRSMVALCRVGQSRKRSRYELLDNKTSEFWEMDMVINH